MIRIKALIVRGQPTQSLINFLKPWLAKEVLWTNSKELTKLNPHQITYRKLDQLLNEQDALELVISYSNMTSLTNDTIFMSHIHIPRVIVDGKPIRYQHSQNKLDVQRTITTPNGATLRPYQVQMVDFVKEKMRAGLFVDMGLGKTLATLATLNELFSEGKLDPKRPVLIVAPRMVALDTWSREASKWGYDIDVLINIGLTPKKRTECFDKLKTINKPTILTTNPEQLENLISYLNQNQLKDLFDCIIIDELSMFKSHTTKRFTSMETLGRNCRYFIGLTGTPAPNSLLDVWSQMITIDPYNKQLLGPNYYVYRERYFLPDIIDKRTGQVYKWKLKPGADKAIYKQLSHSALSMRSEGLIELPEVTYVNEMVKLPPKALKEYKRLDKEIRQTLRDTEDQTEIELDGQLVTIANSAILASKLLQVASGAVYNDLLDDERHTTGYVEIHSEKLKRLKEMIETSSSPILVFYNFKSDIERARKVIEFEELDPKNPNVTDTIARWNKGEIPVLFAHPQSTGHGLNLQDGGHTVVWLTMTWLNEVYRQANKRLHRSGQKYPVQIIHLIAEGTIDEEVVSRIDKKEEGQQALLNALK